MKKITAAEFDAIKTKILAIEDEPIAAMEFPDIDLVDLDGIEIQVAAPRAGSTATAAKAPVRATRGRRKISIRIPDEILAAFRERSEKTCQPYQKLINKALKETVTGWSSV